MYRGLFVFALLCICSCGCGDSSSSPDTLIESGYDEKEMEAAIARARREVDTFVAELAKPTGESHAVKLAITDAGETEHFWLMDVKHRNGQFEGVINNEPGIVKNVRLGDKRTVNKAEISDWMYIRDGKMYGNYTIRPLLPAMPKEDAEKFRAMLANP
jgi:uncharacterized protein YegJ (DUF2314 family)